jgi:hypothetical protein
MNKGGNRYRAFHGIWQSYMQAKLRRFTKTTNAKAKKKKRTKKKSIKNKRKK